MPWPTPMHMVARARRAPRSCSSMRGGQGEPGAAGAQRVAQGDRAAVRVDVLGVVGQAELPEHGQGLRGERLVQLDHVQVGDGQPVAGQQLLRGRHRADAHDSGAAPRPPRPR